MAYQPKTGARCGCRRGIMRDNCPNCEGTGYAIDFAAIRARRLKPAEDDQCFGDDCKNHGDDERVPNTRDEWEK